MSFEGYWVPRKRVKSFSFFLFLIFTYILSWGQCQAHLKYITVLFIIRAWYQAKSKHKYPLQFLIRNRNDLFVSPQYSTFFFLLCLYVFLKSNKTVFKSSFFLDHAFYVNKSSFFITCLLGYYGKKLLEIWIKIFMK